MTIRMKTFYCYDLCLIIFPWTFCGNSYSYINKADIAKTPMNINRYKLNETKNKNKRLPPILSIN